MEVPANNVGLDAFLDFLYGGLEGYVYLAASDPNDKTDWKQEFFEYPRQVERLKQVIRAATKSHEVYIAPALFSSENALRSNFKTSNVVWTEFDGNAPEWHEDNSPSLIVQSSTASNQHVYWKLTEPITEVDVLEDINRRITYNMGADSSAWDANQVLRPPETHNHKRTLSVSVLELNSTVFSITAFDKYGPAPKQVEGDWDNTVLPSSDSVILKYAFGPDIIGLLAKEKDNLHEHRSTALMNLAYACAQLGLKDTEIMVMLLLADNKWEKFKHRKDRMKRLAHIITIARNKYPSDAFEDDSNLIQAFGFEAFLETEINIDWVIEPMLMDQGSMLLVGPSGVGKSQWTLQFLIHLALGQDYLHYKVSEPKKVAFISLEMGHGELKIFLEAMNNVLTAAARALLQQNLIIVPYGEPWFLNTVEGQNELIKIIEEYSLQGIAVDSIGSAINGNISSDESIQPFTKFNDKIRKKYGIFTWYIHHMRKAKDGISTQDDVYGNQYLLNRSTSTYALLKGKGGTIRVRNFKNRLAPHEGDFFVTRNENLVFSSINNDIDQMTENNLIKDDTPVGDDETTENGKFFL